MEGSTQGPRESWLGMRMMEAPVWSAVWWEGEEDGPTALVTGSVLLYLSVIDHQVIYGDQVMFYLKHSILSNEQR